MQQRFLVFFSAFALVVLMVFSGCRDPKCEDCDLPPEDGDPQVTLISPENGHALLKVGETVDITFEIHDNEELVNWNATERWEAVNGTEVLAETNIAGENTALSTNSDTRVISYTVPTGVQVYTTIEIRGYATDNKGKIASSLFKISVLPSDNDTTSWMIQEYTDDTIFNFSGSMASNGYNFDLINRVNGTDAQIAGPNRYLRNDYTGGDVFTSPVWSITDSVLVTTNTSVFDYTNLTYESMWQAFVTSNRISFKTDVLTAGDVVILKMPNVPHYCAVYIKDLVPGEFVVFDYKYSF